MTVLDTVYDALAILTDNWTNIPHYYLIPEPCDGPPYPEKNIFYNRDDIPGINEVASADAHNILKDFRKTRNIDVFKAAWEEFKRSNPEYEAYMERMNKREKEKMKKEERIYKAIKSGVDNFKEYIEYRTEKDKEHEDEEHYKIVPSSGKSEPDFKE